MRVTVVDERSRLLTFEDYEVIDTLVYQMRQNRMTLRLGEEVSGLERLSDERGERVCVTLGIRQANPSGKRAAQHRPDRGDG